MGTIVTGIAFCHGILTCLSQKTGSLELLSCHYEGSHDKVDVNEMSPKIRCIIAFDLQTH